MLLAGRRRRRARDVPRARPAARDARSARGVQARDRRPVRATRTRRGRRRTRACAATARFASTSSSRSPSVPAPTSCGRATTRASSSATGIRLVARAARRAEGPVVHARGASIRRSSSACGSRSASRRRTETRAEAAGRRARRGRRGARARRRASSAATTTARSSSGRAFAASAGAIVDEHGEHGSARTTATGGSRPVSGAGCGVDGGRPLYVLRHRRGRRTRSSVGPRERARRRRRSTRTGRLYVPCPSGEVKLRYRSAAVRARP